MYGQYVKITRDMILADDYGYYEKRFFTKLKQSKQAAIDLLESIEAKKRLIKGTVKRKSRP